MFLCVLGPDKTGVGFIHLRHDSNYYVQAGRSVNSAMHLPNGVYLCSSAFQHACLAVCESITEAQVLVRRIGEQLSSNLRDYVDVGLLLAKIRVGEFNQQGTETGRVSSKEPNQTSPPRSENDEVIRSNVVKSCVQCGADVFIDIFTTSPLCLTCIGRGA
jgi:hypothetical protein